MANIRWIIVLPLIWFCCTAGAATYLNFTRLILNEKERETTFSIKNEGDSTVLMQLWTDRDNILDKPEQIRTPFLIQPPIFRLNQKESRAVRLQFVGDKKNLPENQESLFWLNALEVPPKPEVKDGNNNNALQVAFRTRIKIFYRPDAVAKLQANNEAKNISALLKNCGGRICMEMNNPSPLHFTLLEITLDDGQKIKDLPDDGMILPRSLMSVPLGKSVSSGVKLTSFTWVDDYGAEVVTHKN